MPEDGSEGLPGSVKALFAISALMLIGFVIFVMFSFEGKSDEEVKLQRLEAEKAPTGRDDHRELRFAYDEEPIENLQFVALPEEGLDEIRVIGIEVGGEAVALALTAEAKDFLFIRTMVNNRSIVAVHNYLGAQTNVFAGEGAEPLALKLGGQDVVRDVVLMYEDVRYTQNSSRIPVAQYPFEVTTLDKWAEKHPNTTVCLRELTFEMWEDGKFF
jgi:hypothetical protein